jgi:hypothetical protein
MSHEKKGTREGHQNKREKKTGKKPRMKLKMGREIETDKPNERLVDC